MLPSNPATAYISKFVEGLAGVVELRSRRGWMAAGCDGVRVGVGFFSSHGQLLWLPEEPRGCLLGLVWEAVG